MVRLLEEGRMEGLAVDMAELHLFGLLTVRKEKRATGMPYFTFTRSILKLARKRVRNRRRLGRNKRKDNRNGRGSSYSSRGSTMRAWSP